MRSILLIVALAFSAQSHAIQFMKCNSAEGKTFWATFGAMSYSNKPDLVYYPIDFTLLNGEKSLQDRLYFHDTDEALKIPLQISSGSISFSFMARGADGVTMQTEEFQLSVYDHRHPDGFVGFWRTYNTNNVMIQSVRVGCSVY